VESIGLYQLHAVDAKVGLADSLGELMRLRQEGKIRHIGLSNISPAELEQALAMSPIASVQNRCNVLEQRDFKYGLVRMCADHGVAFIPHSPVGGHQGHARLRGNSTISALAQKHDASVYQIALAWLLHKGAHIIPIPGASRPASAVGSLGAVGIQLTAEEIGAMDRLG
jgi:aryl-alcohol dehydrogenase-like predicted oxidoreductase